MENLNKNEQQLKEDLKELEEFIKNLQTKVDKIKLSKTGGLSIQDKDEDKNIRLFSEQKKILSDSDDSLERMLDKEEYIRALAFLLQCSNKIVSDEDKLKFFNILFDMKVNFGEIIYFNGEEQDLLSIIEKQKKVGDLSSNVYDKINDKIERIYCPLEIVSELPAGMKQERTATGGSFCDNRGGTDFIRKIIKNIKNEEKKIKFFDKLQAGSNEGMDTFEYQNETYCMNEMAFDPYSFKNKTIDVYFLKLLRWKTYQEKLEILRGNKKRGALKVSFKFEDEKIFNESVNRIQSESNFAEVRDSLPHRAKNVQIDNWLQYDPRQNDYTVAEKYKKYDKYEEYKNEPEKFLNLILFLNQAKKLQMKKEVIQTLEKQKENLEQIIKKMQNKGYKIIFLYKLDAEKKIYEQSKIVFESINNGKKPIVINVAKLFKIKNTEFQEDKRKEMCSYLAKQLVKVKKSKRRSRGFKKLLQNPKESFKKLLNNLGSRYEPDERNDKGLDF